MTYRATNRCCQVVPEVGPWVPVGRRLVIVDVENIAGGAGADAEAVRSGLERLRVLVGDSAHDLWIYACGPTMFSTVMSLLCGQRVLLGHGVDGADRRLLEVLAPSEVAGRFTSVVLASGDGQAFAEPVRRLAHAGVATDVVGHTSSTGHRLRALARSFTSLHEPSSALAA